MAYKRSDLKLTPSDLSTIASTSKLLPPEFSEDPVLHHLHTSDTKNPTEKSYLHPTEAFVHLDLNSSSHQASTQHSTNSKKSFFLNSPHRSFPSTSFLLSNKIKELQGQNVNLKLEQKLRRMEASASVGRGSEVLHADPIIDFERERYTKSMVEPMLESSLVIEGHNDIEIPHLRWCAACMAEVTTKVVYINNSKTFWSAVGIFLIGGVIGCFLFPYMSNSCKGVRLICHNCGRTLL